MDTKIFIVNNCRNLEYIQNAANIIKEGGLVAFPTETVYGLGANALDQNAVKKIFEAKGRPQDNPLIIHVANKEISDFVEEVPKVAEELMEKYWPGPLTLILKKKSIIPNVTSANLDSIGIRMPSNEIAKKLIELSGVPIAAPSANISGRPSPTDVERCIEDLSGRVDCILGGDNSEVGLESTIVDCTVEPPIVLRPGGITLEMLKEVHGGITLDKGLMSKPKEDFKPKAPGMKYRHYAPKAKLVIVCGENKKTVEKITEMVHNYMDEGKKVGILTTSENAELYKAGEKIILGSREDLAEIGSNLFESLRKFDDLHVDIILSEALEEHGVGIAIMNRLKKAAGYDIINV